MKKIILFICVAAIFTACSKPASEQIVIPPALEKVIAGNSNCTCDPYISQYQWKGDIVYVLGYLGPACSWTPGYFDKDGNVITMPAGYSIDSFFQEAVFSKVIWRCGHGM